MLCRLQHDPERFFKNPLPSLKSAALFFFFFELGALLLHLDAPLNFSGPKFPYRTDSENHHVII